MADQALKDKVRTALADAYFNQPTDYIAVTDSEAGDMRVLIVSPQLGGKRAKEKRDLVWGALFARLTQPEWGQIVTLVAKTPDEVMAE